MDEDGVLNPLSELKSRYPPIIVEEAPEPTLNYDIHGPRLIINNIEIENFKSYGGVKTLGPFHKNFTCVIGPNGSGKSNVIDSLLFVFGFRASKIRSKKLSVLIHKSELYPNVCSCSVKVFFQRIKPTGDGDDEYEVIDSSEFVVSRTAFRDNTSIYKINEKKANGKEISDFLKKQGIDLDHNRFLILQGEVEQIALMKPKAATEYEDGLLEYLEDIIGSNRFKEPLNVLHQRLEELCELRADKLNRVKIIGKEKKDLEGVRNEAVKYLRICNEITVRKNITFQLKLRDLRALESTALEQYNAIKEQLNNLISELTEINKSRSEKEKELKETTKQHMIKSQKFEVTKQEFTALEIEDAALRDTRKHTRSKIDELIKSIKTKEKELVKYEKVPEESVPRIEQLTGEIKTLEGSKVKEEENLAKVQREANAEKMERQNVRAVKVDEWRKEQAFLTKQEAEISNKKCQLDCLTKNRTQITNIKTKLKNTTEKITETKEKLNRLKDEIPKISGEYKKTNEEIEKLSKIKQEMQDEFDQLMFIYNSGESRQAEQKVINFLLTQQALGQLKGVIGRLGNLASVEPKYDVALSTACGRFDSIVTELIENAQKCVESMKIHNVDRAAFIGLDKIQVWEEKFAKPFQKVSNAVRGIDLLNIPIKNLRCAFYFALGDLLVSDDIHSSKKINQGKIKFRIVTLKGEISEKSGAITGGGNRQIKGKICTDPSKIHKSGQEYPVVKNVNNENLQKSVNEKKKKLDEVYENLLNLKRKSEKLQNDLALAYDNQKRFQEILDSLLTEEKDVKNELESLNDKLKKEKPDTKEIENLEAEIEKLNKKYKKDKEVVDKLGKEVEKINEEINSIGRAKLQTIESLLTSISDKIKEKSDTLNKINFSVKNAEKICKKATTTLENMKADKSKLEESFKEMDENLRVLEKKAEKTLELYNQIGEELHVLEKLKEDQGKVLAKIGEDVQKNTQMQDQISRNLSERQMKLDEFKMRITQTKTDIMKLEIYDIPDGEDEFGKDNSFMDLICENSKDMQIFSSQKGAYVGTKLKTYSEEELSSFTIHHATYDELQDKMNKQKPNLAAIEEYRAKEEMYMQRAAELNEVTEIRDFQREQLEKMKRQRHQEFTAGFNLITGKLKEMYQMITMGGDAELELVDSLDPFSEGILFSVRPPKKSWKNISNLSGGEKTLSSLSLVFALHHFKPTPFYVMDEIDAALDFKNVSIVANYLKDRTKNAQFIIISLRNNMYELADRLVGIYKPFNVSKTCVVNQNALSHCLKSSKQQKLTDKTPTSTQNIPNSQDLPKQIM